MNKSAKNMEAVAKAKKKHDETCPWGGEGKRVLIHPYDIERMQWEEGDVIAGLVVMADTTVNTGMFRVECDAEPNDANPKIEEDRIKDDILVTA